jgi:hypothetical protein
MFQLKRNHKLKIQHEKNKSLHKEQVSKEFIITLNVQQVAKVKDQHTFE